MNVIDFSRLGFYQMLVANAPSVPEWYRQKVAAEHRITPALYLGEKIEEAITMSWPHYWAEEQMKRTDKAPNLGD